MILLKMKQEIILLSVREGKSQREISKLTGVHRKTMNKYLEEYEACLKNFGKRSFIIHDSKFN